MACALFSAFWALASAALSVCALSKAFEPAAFALRFVVAFAVAAAFAAAPLVVDTFFIGVCFDEVKTRPCGELLYKYTKAFDISKDGRKLIYCLWSGLCCPVAAGLRCMGCANRGERSPLAHKGKRSRP
jgi:hypothetical protein